MNEHEHRLLRATRILLNWARKHGGVSPPFPVFHPHMGKLGVATQRQWKAPRFTDSNVTMETFVDGEEAIIVIADELAKQDKDLDPEAKHDPSSVAVWLINIPAWGSTQYVATEAEAEEWRKFKARSERSVGATKRRLTGATPQEKARYARVGAHHLE